MRSLRVALAQVNPTVGDLEGNRARILEYVERAREAGADLVAFPELALTGYPPEDLLLKPSFIRDNLASLRAIASQTRGITAVVGFVDAGEDIYNAAAVIHDGEVAGVYHKVYLPNYGVFDEQRYFRRGREQPLFLLHGVKVGVSICEDIWYPTGPAAIQSEAGAQLLVNINASPYHAGKAEERRRMLATRAVDNGVLVCYVNTVGGQDELVFDGASMVFDQTGRLLARGRQFEEESRAGRPGRGGRLPLPASRPPQPRGAALPHPGRRADPADHPVGAAHRLCPRAATGSGRARCWRVPAEVYAALVLGTRDYVPEERLPEGADRPVRRHRLLPHGRHCRGRPGPENVHRGLHALPLLLAGEPGRRARPGRQARHPDAHRPHRARLPGLSRHARGALPGDGAEHGRGEPAGAYSGQHPDGALQQVRLPGADHRQQERDGGGLRHAVRRHGGRLRGHQGRAEDARVPGIGVPQQHLAGHSGGA